METSSDNNILVTTDTKGNALTMRHSCNYTPFTTFNNFTIYISGFVTVWCIENFCLDGPQDNTPESKFGLSIDLICIFVCFLVKACFQFVRVRSIVFKTIDHTALSYRRSIEGWP